jgi:hypothetical protein
MKTSTNVNARTTTVRDRISCSILASLVLFYLGLVFGPFVHEIALSHNLDFGRASQSLLELIRL